AREAIEIDAGVEVPGDRDVVGGAPADELLHGEDAALRRREPERRVARDSGEDRPAAARRSRRPCLDLGGDLRHRRGLEERREAELEDLPAVGRRDEALLL